MDSFPKPVCVRLYEMSKFRKHSIEEMRKRSKMRKQRKKFMMRKCVECVGHSTNEKLVDEGTVNVESKWTNEEMGDHCVEEDKINGNSPK